MSTPTPSAKPKKAEENESFIMRTIFAGMASMTAGFSLHPVDTCKIRMQKIKDHPEIARKYRNLYQTARTIITEEGFLALYKGVRSSLLRESTYSTLRLGLYEPFKALLGETNPKDTPFWKKMASASMSGCIGSAIANPFDLVKVIHQADEKAHGSFLAEVKKILARDGIKGLYRGAGPTIARAMVLNGTKLSTYDEIKHTLLKIGWLKEGFILQTLSSCVAGLAMTITTAPFDLVKTRIMSQGEQKIYHGVLDCFTKSVKKEGIFVLWKGFTPQWLRFTPFTIIQLNVWEYLRKLYGMKGI
jgi:hypothetical protein